MTSRNASRLSGGDPVQPWIGPDSYSERQQGLFKGRDEERDDILRLLLRDVLTVLFGASGLGKTSLLQAGLFPELRKREMLPVYLRLDHNETALPLAQQILEAARMAASTSQALVQSPSFDIEQSLWQNFHREDALFWSGHHKIITPVIVLDQFEEIFTRGQRNEQCVQRSEAFLSELADLIENHVPSALVSGLDAEGRDAIDAGYVLGSVPLKIIISLREDYLAPLEQLRQRIPLLGTNRMRLTHLSISQAHEVVEAPAAPYNLLAEGVADQIVKYVSASDRSVTKRDGVGAVARVARISSSFEPEVDPALLSIFCFELNTQRQQAGMPQITLELLNASKDQILLGFYERAFEGVPKQVRRFVEDRLVSPQGYRDSRTLDDALSTPGVTQESLDLLVARRLLCYEEQGSGPKRVELKHDVFLRVAEARRTARALVERRWERLRNVLRRASLLGVPILLAVLVIAAIGYRYLYVWRYEAYYATFVKVRGEPRGVGPVSAAERAHRQVTLRIVRRGRLGHVMSMEALDSRGRLTVDHGIGTFVQYYDPARPRRHMEARWEFVYDSAGQVVAELAFDRGIGRDVLAHNKPRLVWQFLYSPSVQQQAGNERVGHFLGERGVPLAFMRAFVRLEHDPITGFETKVRYFDDFNRPLPIRDRAFGQSLHYDSNGRLLKMTSLDADGRPMMDEVGNATLDMVNNDHGEVMQNTLLDLAAKPTVGVDGYMRVVLERDRWGNITSRAFFAVDAAGKWQKVTDKSGCHKQVYARDAQGLVTSFRSWDELGKPTHDVDGCYGHNLQLDDAGNVWEDTCVGATGRPAMNAQGWAVIRRQFDAGGDTISEAAFDDQGRPTNRLGGAGASASARVHRVRFERDDEGRETAREYYWGNGDKAYLDGTWRTETRYDAHGTVVSVRYLDEHGAPAPTRLGYARIDYTRDGAGRLKRASYRDVAGRPVLGRDGFASWAQEYDDRGYLALTTYYGVDNLEVVQQGGFTRLAHSAWDGLGNPTKTEFLGMDGKSVVTTSGVTGYNSTYDARGLEVERSYFGSDGQAVMHSSGYSRWRASYDRLGRTVRMSLFGSDGQPVAGREGTAGWSKEFDPWGNELKHTNIGPDDNPAMSAFGYVHELRVFDRQHNTLQTAYKDAADRLTSKPETCAARKYVFDNARNLLAEECFDGTDKPRLNEEGVFRTTHEYDERGMETKKRFFGIFSQPVFSKGLRCHGVDYVYDVHGNAARLSYQGQDERPIIAVDGVAVLDRKYASYDQLIEESGLDTEGNKVSFRTGYHRELRDFDSSGRLLRRRYLGQNDEPVLHENGYAEVRYAYRAPTNNRSPAVQAGDSEGEDELRYLDTEGQLVRSRFGYARRESTYTSDGRLKSQTFFSEKGSLVANRDGYARVDKDYRKEPGRDVTEIRLYSPEGRPVLAHRENDLFANMMVTKNDFGQTMEVSFQNAAGRPAPQSDGCSTWKFAYDSRGNRVKGECYLGTSKSAVHAPRGRLGGYHAWRADFDAQGNILYLETLGADDRLIVNGARYARQRFAYDEKGRELSCWNTDPAGLSIESTEGWARRELRYDEYGNLVGMAYYGSEDRPTAVDGVARYVASYDKSGHLLSAARFDAQDKELDVVHYEYDRRGLLVVQKAERDGKPIPLAGTPWYEVHYRHDPWGRVTLQLNYGTGGKPAGLCPATIYHYDSDGTMTKACGPIPR